MKFNLLLPALIFLLLTLGASSVAAQNMDNEKLEKILYVVGDTLTGSPGLWHFSVGEVVMMCITDEVHNRMRIISPISETADLTADEMQAAMEANFHSALDARYAVSEGMMWAAYIHPLKELHKEQVVDAISQVYNGVLTFGTTYSSTDLAFPKQEKKELKTKKS